MGEVALNFRPVSRLAKLKEKIPHRLTRPGGRPALTKVRRFYEDVECKAASWDKPRVVIVAESNGASNGDLR